MLDPFSRNILNSRPNIHYISPPSEGVVPEPDDLAVSEIEDNQKKIKQLATGFKNIVNLANEIEKEIDSRAKKLKATLDIAKSPEDLVAAQALARIFPDKAKEISPGVLVVEEMTYDMFKECLKCLEDNAVSQAAKSTGSFGALSSGEAGFDPQKVDFGGLQKPSRNKYGEPQTNRPDINNIATPIEPINMAAFIAAGVPALFAMLFPLISGYVNGKIVAHTHATIVPPAPAPVPSGPGIPLTP